jgi:hypothetical protein
MKDKKELLGSIKAYALNMLGNFVKVKPIIRNNIKFIEANFVIRFDITSIKLSSTEIALGDICQLDINFYKTFFGFNELSKQIKERRKKSFVVIAFVELRSKNHRDLFCVLGESDDPSAGTLDIQEEDGFLLLFWPEGLKKVKREK